MPTVVFFISGHGFGHASRDVEVINALGASRPDLRLILRTDVNPGLLDRTVRPPFERRPGPCDTGIIQRTSVEHDDEATVRAAIDFYSPFDERIDTEARTFERDKVSLIVGDIPPLAFEAAARLGVPSVCLGNFTWAWIYDTHPGMVAAAPWLVPLLQRAYAKAGRALQLPFAGGFEIFPDVRPIPLIARRPGREPRDTRTFFGIPHDRPTVLLSFGGYGMPALDLSSVDCSEWTVVLTDRILPPDRPLSPRVVFLREEQFLNTGYRYEDLVAAVDVVMSKPGYGIVSECIACDTPLLYTSRGVFREYDLFVREMPRYLRCRFIDHVELFAGRWRAALEALRGQPSPPETMAVDGADVAARELSRVAQH